MYHKKDVPLSFRCLSSAVYNDAVIRQKLVTIIMKSVSANTIDFFQITLCILTVNSELFGIYFMFKVVFFQERSGYSSLIYIICVYPNVIHKHSD